MAGVGGGRGGFGGWPEAAAASSFRGGSGKVKLVLGLGLAQKVCTFLISHRPDDKSVSRVRGLIKRARLTREETAKAIANPNTNSSSLPLAPRSLAHYKLNIHNNNFLWLKTGLQLLDQPPSRGFWCEGWSERPGLLGPKLPRQCSTPTSTLPPFSRRRFLRQTV